MQVIFVSSTFNEKRYNAFPVWDFSILTLVNIYSGSQLVLSWQILGRSIAPKNLPAHFPLIQFSDLPDFGCFAMLFSFLFIRLQQVWVLRKISFNPCFGSLQKRFTIIRIVSYNKDGYRWWQYSRSCRNRQGNNCTQAKRNDYRFFYKIYIRHRSVTLKPEIMILKKLACYCPYIHMLSIW